MRLRYWPILRKYPHKNKLSINTLSRYLNAQIAHTVFVLKPLKTTKPERTHALLFFYLYLKIYSFRMIRLSENIM